MRQGFHEVVHSAFAIDRLAGPLCTVGGWTRTDLPDAPPEQWAAWHVPLIIGADYNGGTPAWYSVLCFCAMVVAMGFLNVRAWSSCAM